MFVSVPGEVVLGNRLIAVTLTALIILNVESPALAQRVVAQGTVIKNVTVISPERMVPLPHADVVLSEGKITNIGTNFVPGPNAQRIDGSGRFLIPGLIDSHVHAGHSSA